MNVALEKFSVAERACYRVRELVLMFKERLVKGDVAIPEVAGILDLTPRRVRALAFRDEFGSVTPNELTKIETRIYSYLDKEIELSIERTEKLRLTKRQLGLGLGLECSENSRSDWQSQQLS